MATTHVGDFHPILTDATHNPSLTDYVTAYLGDAAEDFEVEAIVDALRDAINNVLPDGLSLYGDELYGEYGVTYDFEAIRETTDDIDFWAIAARFEK